MKLLFILFFSLSLAWNDTIDITRQYHIIDLMLDVRVGDTVYLNILRGGVEMTVEMTITEDCLTAY